MLYNRLGRNVTDSFLGDVNWVSRLLRLTHVLNQAFSCRLRWGQRGNLQFESGDLGRLDQLRQPRSASQPEQDQARVGYWFQEHIHEEPGDPYCRYDVDRVREEFPHPADSTTEHVAVPPA